MNADKNQTGDGPGISVYQRASAANLRESTRRGMQLTLVLIPCLALAAHADVALTPALMPVPHYVRMQASPLTPLPSPTGRGAGGEGFTVPPIPELGVGPQGCRDARRIFLPGIDSFAAPDTTPFGLEWIGDKLWHCDLRAQRIFQLEPDNGTVLRSFAAPDYWSKDLAWDGSYLYACGNYQGRIYKLDTISGNVINSFGAPGSNPSGLCFDGTYLWNADWNSDQSQPSLIYKLNPANGQVISSILTPAEWPAGLAWDGSCLWNVDQKQQIIYKLDPATGAVLGAVGVPGNNPTGLAWDGTKLWNADWNHDMIYRFAPDSAPPVIAIASPHSLDALPCWRNVVITGTIWGSDLVHYQVEYAVGEIPGIWTPIGGLQVTPVYLDTIQSWDVSGITVADIYWLRVNAVFASHIDSLHQVKISLDPQIMPGWPQTLVNVSPVGVADVDGNSEDELFAGLHHQDGFNQKLGGWRLDGGELSGFPVAGINNCQMAPAFARLPHTEKIRSQNYELRNHRSDFIIPNSYFLLQSDSFGIATGYDLNQDQVNIVRPDGAMLTGWPQTGGHPGNYYYLGLPVLADVNGDSLPEVFAGGSTLSGWHLDGTPLWPGPVPSQSSSPAIGDLNRDGFPDLVFIAGSNAIYVMDSSGAALPPFPKTYSGSASEQYPVLGDINSDQQLEIVFNLGTKLYAVDDTGGVLTGFPKTLSGSYANSPVLGDIDRDGCPEIVVASGAFPSYSEIAAFRYTGTPVSGFPKRLNGKVFRSFNEPVLGDVNGDSFPEIVMGFELENTFEEVHALMHDGGEALGWPKRLRDIYGYGITGAPVLGDFDHDGEVNMAISSNAYWMANSDIYVWNLDQPLVAAAMPWPTQRHDNQRTACLGNVLTGVTERISQLVARGLQLTAQPNPFRNQVTIRILGPGPSPLTSHSAITIYDAAGCLVRTLKPLSPEPLKLLLTWDGRDLSGRRVSSGVYFARMRIGRELLSARLVLQ